MSAVPAVSNPASPAKAIRPRRWRVPFVRGSSAVIAILLAASIFALPAHECGILCGRSMIAIGSGVITVGRSGWRDSADRADTGSCRVVGCNALAAYWDSQANWWQGFGGAWRPFHRREPGPAGVGHMLVIPAWQPLLFFACIACISHGVIIGRRGIRLIRCGGCGYDITGLRADPATGARTCPECGSAVESS